MQFEASRLEGLEHRTDAQSAPEVFFTPIITPESLVAAYHALGRKPEDHCDIVGTDRKMSQIGG